MVVGQEVVEMLLVIQTTVIVAHAEETTCSQKDFYQKNKG